MIFQYKKTTWFLLLFLANSIGVFGQLPIINLSDAIHLAKENYIGLERDRLQVTQYQQLAKAGLPIQPTQISISGEEFGATGQSGIHSLNIQQNFYLPKAGNAQNAYYQKGAVVAEKQLALTDKTLEWKVKQAYFQLLYAKAEQVLVEENLLLFENFLTVATTQLETGETGKIPQLAARTRLGQAQLEKEHAHEKHQIALALFNQWLNAETSFDIQGELVEVATTPAQLELENPHLQIILAEQDQAVSAIELEKSKLLPQINTGARLQNVNGDFPAFGYQIGINMPLFKKAYNKKIEAAEIGVKSQEAALLAERQKLTRINSELRYRLEHQAHVLAYLDKHLKPIVKEQVEVNYKAYREGEINYLEYLNSLEQAVQVKQQYLEALYEYNLLQIEMEYWMGR